MSYDERELMAECKRELMAECKRLLELNKLSLWIIENLTAENEKLKNLLDDLKSELGSGKQ